VRGMAEWLVARMVAQRDLLQEMDERFSSISANVASPDESVSVEVDGLGAMTGLWLGPQALKLEPDALAKLVVDTATAAARVALDRQDLLINELNHRMRAVRDAPLTLWDGATIDSS
jgi:hypothetical protein